MMADVLLRTARSSIAEAPPHHIEPAVQGANVDVRVARVSARAWDQFAAQAGASFRCAKRSTRAWQFEQHWFYRLHRFELFIDGDHGERKIGQCAVGVGRRRSVFSDCIQLLPEFDHLWPDAMRAVLTRLGPAVYVYGSEWSLQPPRETLLGRLAGVEIQEVYRTFVDAVDFRQWPSFDAYRRAVSSNARRNAKKASAVYPGLSVEAAGGMAGLHRLAASVLLRRALFARKGLEQSSLKMLLRSVARSGSMGHHRRLAYLVHGRRLLAYQRGIAFGADWSYIEGAASPEADGAAWYLLMQLLEHAYCRSFGAGRFIMGSDDGSKSGDSWEGLRRSRRQCRTTAFPTSVLRFRYAVD